VQHTVGINIAMACWFFNFVDAPEGGLAIGGIKNITLCRANFYTKDNGERRFATLLTMAEKCG